LRNCGNNGVHIHFLRSIADGFPFGLQSNDFLCFIFPILEGGKCVKTASTTVNRRHQQHFEALKEKEQRNLDEKTVICEIVCFP